MSYLVVENFSAGLDTRRHPLTAKSGTLQKLDNAHISRGGEIEKRKSFVEFANLNWIDALNAPNYRHNLTFGMEATADAIYVFGSIDPSMLTMPTGITYQRLSHPDGLDMVKVVHSSLYGGKPFVIAEYEDGHRYCFYDGAIVADFVNGIVRPTMTDLAGVATHLTSVITGDYTATNSGNVITVTGKPSVVFEPSATADSPMTVTTATIQKASDAVVETLSSGSFTIINGSNGSAFASKYMGGYSIASLPGITGLYIDGVEIFGYGSVIYGTTIPEYAPGHGDPAPRLAWTLCSIINGGTSTHGYSATYNYYKYSGADAAVLTILADPKLGSSMNGKTIQFEYLSDPGENPTDYLTTDNVISPYDTSLIPTRYIGNFGGGTLTGGVDNVITSIKVDGVEALGSTVHWVKSNTDTSLVIATTINTYTGSTDYEASVSAGNVVLTALAGTGKSPNGKHITVTTSGNFVISGIKSFDGGKDGVAAVSQISTYTLGGTFTVGGKITLIATPALDSAYPIYWGATRVANTTPAASMTFKTKEHIISGSSLFFSGVNQPTMWGYEGTGSGFINMSNNFGGNEVLTGLALYQGYMAIFARRSVQVWKMDPDPALNVQGQVISNTGAIAPKSVISVGEIDVFYLSDSGVRSLRARDASNAAIVNDVGTPIDSLVLADLSEMTDDEKSKCCSIVEPVDGRYWIAIGDKIYVYSYFPSGQVAAWSTYSPGFAVSKFVTKDNRIYARSGDVIYVYGGSDGNTYDNSTVELILPYLDASKPAHIKTFNGVDMTVQGEWVLEVGMDPLAPNAREVIATLSQPSFSLNRIAAAGMGTHFGVRMTCDSSGYARLANFIVHYELNDAS
ncbi:hypothetical protein UFOVP1533_28 [uncultured Caudovirales phage]|uniref:Uncharacterized protein n=1 Tax=uncultured Caudovirales phage TaxID=2100421 RepID=A0A6J5SFE1_9CAUD|nr:hypothetical protein UFOVP1086_28 [uncultured Caudovirales phage]CAB4212707.1 hypothetical protein UFOVP1440_28 [uncultured Caudovirales phage]CAB5228269.1 hypothetical protein UFOVP1533_28 [uncultured Caudovirales phage]